MKIKRRIKIGLGKIGKWDYKSVGLNRTFLRRVAILGIKEDSEIGGLCQGKLGCHWAFKSFPPMA